MKRVLLTGGTGFIGRQCIKYLNDYGYEIHATFHRNPLNNKIYWYKADLLNLTETTHLINFVQPTHILHTAWYMEHDNFWDSENNYLWVQASHNLLAAAEAFDVERFVGVGSCSEYNHTNDPCREYITPITPSSVYGKCKAATQSIFEGYSNKNQTLSIGWGRLFYLFGENENQKKVISSVIRSLIQDVSIKCTDGRQIRDYLYVKDAASALVSFLESKVSGPVNIASGNALQVRDILKLIAEITGRGELLKLGALETRKNEPKIIKADVTRLNNEVGWELGNSIEDGLITTVDWLKSIKK